MLLAAAKFAPKWIHALRTLTFYVFAYSAWAVGAAFLLSGTLRYPRR